MAITGQTANPAPERHIDLQKGWPTPRLLPATTLRAAAETVLVNPKRATEALLYGPNKGDPGLRKACADWFQRLYHLPSSREDNSVDRICITSGASANLGCIMAAFTDSIFTRRIFMVEPTYFLACTVFEDFGFQGRLVGVPEDGEGLDVTVLRERLEAADRQGGTSDLRPFKMPPQYPKLYRHVIYLTPTFSNPSAKTYSVARREALIDLAREKDALIITDDCYDFLNWDSTTQSNEIQSNGDGHVLHSVPPRLVDIDSARPGGDLVWGNTVSNGSFSKVMGPGMRCGWAEATPKFITKLNQVGSTLSGGAPGQFSSVLVEHALRTGSMEDHIRDVVVPVYRQRAAALRKAVETYLCPLGVVVDEGISSCGHDDTRNELRGGFFLYLNFPEGILADDVAAHALERYNVKFLAASSMTVRGSGTSTNILRRGARLCWAWEEESLQAEGVKRIASALADLIAQ